MPRASVYFSTPVHPRLQSRLFAVAVGLLSTLARADPAGNPRDLFGRVIDRVICERDATQSYALYVPANYSAERKWPAIFCFEPSARGLIPVERLKVAAEKYGYVVAASLTSRNGPWTQNAKAAEAMVRDVTAHFSIDPQRLYTAGMSGGARVATSIALSGVAKGVIACGAGFPVLPGGIPKQLTFVFFGVAGVEDFNHAELQRLDADLADRRTPHRIVSFDGGHVWAPATVLTEGVEWLEVQAMRAGTRPRDAGLIEALWRIRQAAVPTTPELARWKALQSLVADFEGLTDTAGPAREAIALAATRELKNALGAEQRQLAREDELLSELANAAILGAGNKRQFALELKRKADAPPDSAERRMIRRAIAGYSSMARETVRGFIEQADYDSAEAYLEFGVAVRPDHKGLWFDLARARAFNGNRKGAIAALEQAAGAGYSDPARAEAEPAFAKLRHDPRFQAVVAKFHAEAINPSLQLPALRVSAALAGAELRLCYLPPNGPGTQPLSFLRVETVRPDSSAARAGLQEGMEITALQGLQIRGLVDRELNDAMARPVKKEIVLTARKPNDVEQELRIPLRRPMPVEDGPHIRDSSD